MATKPSPPIKKLVVIEDATIIGFANQPQILKQFPFLRSLKGAGMPTGCASCSKGRKQAQRTQTLLASAKSSLVGMGDDKKRALKRLLNTEKVRITLKQGKRIVQHTF
jgi:hypothetical protein